MFAHAYGGYMRYAYPADELRPLTGSGANVLGSIGDHARNVHPDYRGVALSLIDSLSALAIMGNASEFRRGVQRVAALVDFDQDVR
jgi:ER degradation enhancer, mannosidase alpha-like 1